MQSQYKWVQKDTSIQLTVNVPPSVKKTDCDVKFGKSYLYVGAVGRGALLEVRCHLAVEMLLSFLFKGYFIKFHCGEEVKVEIRSGCYHNSSGESFEGKMG
jgi:hypothetical protein